MTLYIKYTTVLIVIILSAGFAASAFSTSLESNDNKLLYFAGGDILYSRRIGSSSFEPIAKRQDFKKNNLFQYGFTLGKRYYAVSWLRYQLEGMFHFGKCVEDTILEDSDFKEFSPMHHFNHIGLNLDMHLVRQTNNRLSPYVLCGGGVNYMHQEEETVDPENNNKSVSPINYSGKNIKVWSPNFNLGAGFDYRFTRSMGLSIAYSYRIWKPVKYRDASDMPLEPIEYEERFYTHRFQVNFLFSLGDE